MEKVDFVFPNNTLFLTISERNLIVPKTGGKRTFVGERERFGSDFDQNFIDFDTDSPSEPTEESNSVIYKMRKRGWFRNFVESFNLDTRLLAWHSQDQVLTWIEEYEQYIIPGSLSVMFTMFIKDNLYMIKFDKYYGKTSIRIHPYDYDFVFRLEHQLVFPEWV